MGKKIRRITILMDDADLTVLDDLTKRSGMPTWSDTIRISILITDVLLRAGIFDILKPLPELEKLSLQVSKPCVDNVKIKGKGEK